MPILLAMLAAQEMAVHLVRSADPMTDEQTIAAVSRSSTGDLIYVGCDSVAQSLFVRLQPATSRGRLEPDGVLHYRFDRNEAVTAAWDQDAFSADTNDRAEVEPFVRAFAMATTLRIRMRMIDTSQQDAVFTLNGAVPFAKETVMKVLAACPKSKAAAQLSSELHAS